MDATRAHRLINALAEGVHPLTGECFAADSPYQQAEVVRALYFALRAIEGRPVDDAAKQPAAAPEPIAASAAPNAASKPSKGNVGKPWSSDEERELLARFDAGALPGDLARQHGRSIAGIEARLEKLGRLRPDQRTTSSRFPLRASRDKSTTTSQ